MAGLVGIEQERLQRWLVEHLEGLVAPVGFDLADRVVWLAESARDIRREVAR